MNLDDKPARRYRLLSPHNSTDINYSTKTELPKGSPGSSASDVANWLIIKIIITQTHRLSS